MAKKFKLKLFVPFTTLTILSKLQLGKLQFGKYCNCCKWYR